MNRLFVFLLSGAMVLGLATAAEASTHHKTKPHVSTVVVSEKDFHISMPTTLRAGKYIFRIGNHGKAGHELLLFRTDLPANALPVDTSGDVIEDSPLMSQIVDSGNATKPGSYLSLRPVTLTPGHYVAVCNLPAHYRDGMRLDLTIT